MNPKLINDIVLIDEILPDPYLFIDKVHDLVFDSHSSDRITGIRFNRNPTTHVGWQGCRSLSLSETDPVLYKQTFDEIITRLFFKYKYKIEYEILAHLHFTPSYCKFDNNAWHVDNSVILAGLIYLNPEPKPNSGTLIMRKGEQITIENKFNRLILYRASLLHRPESGYGTDVSDTRLTMPIFVKKLNLEFSTKNRIG